MDAYSGDSTPYLFAIDYESQESFVIPHPEEQKEILFAVEGYNNMQPDVHISDIEPVWSTKPEPFSVYSRRFRRIHDALLRGDSFLANLTIATPISLNLSLHDVFYRSCAPYRLYVPGRFVCFSPEKFVTIDEQGVISTYPMKGTIDATLPDASDLILNNYKETAEHSTIVDLMRNDLNQVADEVRLVKFRYLDRLETINGPILQMSSCISGKVMPGFQGKLGSLISRLLPAGSISGAPKEATVRAIQEAEDRKRGFYSGVFGYYDGSRLYSAVMIRFIEQESDGSLLFRSGGGITINSKVEDEYRETQQKVYLSLKK